MSRPLIINHDVLTNEVTEREMNDAEFTEWQTQVNEDNAAKAEQTAKAKARQAVLDKLGLTADEVAALLS
jgi:hypothetical protein